MSTDSLTANTASTKRGRPHSNTISGGRPPALDITISRPTNIRRNSEGSPGVPPPICISEPTPIEPSKDHANGFFNNTSRPATPDTDSAVSSNASSAAAAPPPPAPLPKASATAPVGGTNSLLDSPTQKKKSRSRASSVTSNLINEIKESSTIQSLASKIRSRHSSEDADAPQERNSSDNQSTIAQSVAGASGIYVANAKRNQDFHALFRSVPEEDNLIEDFGCALQKEILLQGRIYISESYLCFNANIFGWVTNLVIAFADIIAIEKKSTAYVIPNAIQISTDSAKHFFASFLSRDQAHDLMVDIWRIARPDLAPPKETDGSSVRDANDVSSSPSSIASSSSGEEEDESDSYYDSDTEDSYSDDTGSEDLDMTDTNATVTQGKLAHGMDEGNRPRKASAASTPNNNNNNKDNTTKMDAAARRRAMSEAPRPNFQSNEEEKASKASAASSGAAAADGKPAKSGDPAADGASAAAAADSAKPQQLHEKTDCECSANNEHYPTVVMDQVYNGTVEKIYNLLFDSGFMKKFLVDNQKSMELEMGEWKKGEGNVEFVRELSYIKPLGGAIGPKQTKCYITQEVLHQDIQKYVTVLATTSTPDVPSGGSFSCKTRTCFTWAGKGKVRVLVTVQVEFTKSSWLKSTIEKASIDGQQTYYKELDAAMRQYFKEHPSEFSECKSSSKRDGGSKSKRRKGRKSRSTHTPKPEETEKKEEKPKSAVHQVLGSISNALADGITSVIDIVSSPRAAHLTLICLVMMVGINIFIARKMAFVEQQLSELSHALPSNAIMDSSESSTVDISFLPGTQRRQYNRQEEQDLWDWLGRIDPDKSNEKREKVQIPLVKDPKEQEAIWDDAIQISKSAKDRLDKHMAELSGMIQKAESNLQDVTQSVNDQRQKIKQDQP
ncbi:hypothetical protein MBANPS3_003286 [Mucor bainieri]